MVGLVLVSHSHAMAEAVKQMVVAMAGSRLPIAIAAGAGENHRDLGTNGVEIMEAINSVLSDDGVLVLMDIGSALLSTDTALSMLDDAQRGRVRCGAGPFVEGAVAAGVVASLGQSLDEVSREAAGALRQKEQHLGGIAPPATGPSSTPGENTARRVSIVVPNPQGWHARPAARFVREAAAFKASIEVRNLTRGHGPASARSVTGLAALEILQGDEVEISADGADAERALQTLRDSVASGLGDSWQTIAATPALPSGKPIPVSEGLAIGPLLLASQAPVEIPREQTANPEGEIAKLRAALDQTKTALEQDQASLRKALGKYESDIFAAQAVVLVDPALINQAENLIHAEGQNAALAWSHAFQAAADAYSRLESEHLRQRATDVRDVGFRVLAALGITRPRVPEPSEPSILVVEDLAPAEVTALPSNVAGVILLDGGQTSHAAILLRARAIPAVARARQAVKSSGIRESPAHLVAIDGTTGELWLDPKPAQQDSLRARIAAQHRQAEEALQLSQTPGATADGYRVPILANLGSVSEARRALGRGAEGVGLFRTEFLFLDRTAAPSEDAQYEALRALAEDMEHRPVIVRTLDIGGDKDVPYLQMPKEANPFLGQRGIRLCLRHPELFQTHLRAILRAAYGANFRIMWPMITELAEVRKARAALEEAHLSLARDGVVHVWPIPVGIMIEVPAAAALADQLSAEVDFFSIGTNDLTQYVLAADRGNPALTHFQDAMHPAVLRTIAQVTAAAHTRGKHVGVCGEAAADAVAARLLIGLGVDELSLSPARIPAIKAAIRSTHRQALGEMARQALQASSAQEVREHETTCPPV